MALDDSESEEEEEEAEEEDMESDLEGKNDEGEHKINSLSFSFGLLSSLPI